MEDLVERIETSWTHSSVIKLIKEYEARPQLWDQNHEAYRLHSIKYDSWQELADMFECDIGSIRRKLNSLFASHRREKVKVKLGGKSTWFLYPYLSFLPTHVEETSSSATTPACMIDRGPKRRKQKQEQISDEEPGEIEALDEDFIQEHEGLEAPVIQEVFVKDEPVPQMPRPIIIRKNRSRLLGLPKRETELKIKKTIKKKAIPDDFSSSSSNLLDSRLSETLNLLKKSELTRRKDECDSFGEYIANSLRKHDERTQCMIKQAINNILFEQEMKKYGNNHQYTVVLTNMDENPLLIESGESITDK